MHQFNLEYFAREFSQIGHLLNPHNEKWSQVKFIYIYGLRKQYLSNDTKKNLRK